MSKKSNKNKKSNNTINRDKKISSVIEVKEKDNKILYVLIIVIAVLSSLLIYYAFIKECSSSCSCDKCETPTIEIEVEPKYQLINFAGFRFKMPLNWDFVSDNNEYTISDSDSKIFISFEEIKEDYELFSSTDYQLNFVEKIQTSDNIKIEQSKKLDNYYSYEGKYNDYNYLIIAIGNDKKTVLVKTQFVDKVTYDNEKNNVIDFVLTSITKSDE